MALSQSDLEKLTELLKTQAADSEARIIAAVQVARKELDGSLRQAVDELRAVQASLPGAVAQQVPSLAPRDIEQAVERQLDTMPGRVLDALQAQAPRLFGADVAEMAGADAGPPSRYHWITEGEGHAAIPRQGMVKYTRGQVLDERSSDIEAVRRTVPCRKLGVAELARYGRREG